MELKVVIDKKFAFMILGGILILAGAIYVNALNPAIFGHDWDEIGNVPADLADGDDVCDSSGQCSKVCIGNDCQTSWPSGIDSISSHYTGSSYSDVTMNLGSHDFCALNRINHGNANQACICSVYKTGNIWKVYLGVDENVNSPCGCGAQCIN